MKICLIEKNIQKIDQLISLNWQDNGAVQALLDVVVEIMAEEYVQIAKENEDVFKDPSVSCPSGTSLGMTGEGGEK